LRRFPLVVFALGRFDHIEIVTEQADGGQCSQG
jgi:hypothetical protein